MKPTNIFLYQLEKELSGKYKKHIISLIEKRLTQKLDKKQCYCELHHILPRSWGGSNKKENLILLTGREHFLIHMMLVKTTTGEKKSKMMYAILAMGAKTKNQTQRYFTSKYYDFIRGKLKVSSETKRKLSEAILNNPEEIKRRADRITERNRLNNVERNKKQGQVVVHVCEICNKEIKGSKWNIKQHNCKKYLRRQSIADFLKKFNINYYEQKENIQCPVCSKKIKGIGNIFQHLKYHERNEVI